MRVVLFVMYGPVGVVGKKKKFTVSSSIWMSSVTVASTRAAYAGVVGSVFLVTMPIIRITIIPWYCKSFQGEKQETKGAGDLHGKTQAQVEIE